MATTWTVERGLSYCGPWSVVVSGIDADSESVLHFVPGYFLPSYFGASGFGPWQIPIGGIKTVLNQNPGTWGWFRVRKFANGTEIGRPSRPLQIAVLSSPIISVTGGERNYIQISWPKTVANKYRVYRSSDSGRYRPLAVVTGTVFNDYAVSNDVTYSYMVTAITDDEIAKSLKSSIVSSQVTEGGVFSMSRASVYQGIQFAPEVTAGIAVPAVQRVKDMEIMFAPDVPKKAVNYMGSRVQTGSQKGKQYTPFRYQGALDYNIFAVIMSSMFGVVAPTSPAATVKTKARIWTPSPVQTYAKQTYTIETGSIQGAEKAANCIFSGMSIKFGKEDASIEGTGFGGLYVPFITPTLGVGAVPLPVLHTNPVDMDQSIGIYTSPDGENWTLLESVLDGEVRMNGLFQPVFHVRDDTNSYDTVVDTRIDFGMQLTVEDGPERVAFWDRLQDKQKLYLGFKCTGPLIEMSTDVVPLAYQDIIKIQMPVECMKPDPGDKNGVYGDSYTFNVTDDETFGIMQATSYTSIATIGTQAL